MQTSVWSDTATQCSSEDTNAGARTNFYGQSFNIRSWDGDWRMRNIDKYSLTKFFPSIIQRARDVGKVNSSSNGHGVSSLVNRNSVKIVKVDFNPVLDCTHGH